ncbi:beta-ketoacyl-ACP synthase [Aliikangiella sp. G2MR2-5]|uniref:beta-ketoacyl-ACP synthase n=1 Tax=Aliikangiella sp. G2MR2-5 TaxID=2788943 RepID=UPI0018A94DF8|nr:beta-ketoacyl-ACP synthase [Aliikangiella sp. G2MR2-5]
MNKRPKVYLSRPGIVCALGCDESEVYQNLIDGQSKGMRVIKSPLRHSHFFVGQVCSELPSIDSSLSELDCRNNQLAAAALAQIQTEIDEHKKCYSAHRLGVVVGTSTSGIAEAEQALNAYNQSQKFPESYHYKKQELGSLAEFVAEFTGATGPSYVVSTACSSSGKVFASARTLIERGLCDAVIVGGADSICELTLSGFESLEATSSERTIPFSRNRNGINIGEGAAFFVMSRAQSPVELLGVGESSDAYHMSAPEPDGKGACLAMRRALEDSGLEAEEVDYLNLHGTGTRLNDQMESRAVHLLFGESLQVSSTKPLTGHALGAAGAIEAAICWTLLAHREDKKVAPHIFDGCYDPELSPVALCESSESKKMLSKVMSNSFAFGGNNVSVILGSCHE